MAVLHEILKRGTRDGPSCCLPHGTVKLQAAQHEPQMGDVPPRMLSLASPATTRAAFNAHPNVLRVVAALPDLRAVPVGLWDSPGGVCQVPITESGRNRPLDPHAAER